MVMLSDHPTQSSSTLFGIKTKPYHQGIIQKFSLFSYSLRFSKEKQWLRCDAGSVWSGRFCAPILIPSVLVVDSINNNSVIKYLFTLILWIFDNWWREAEYGRLLVFVLMLYFLLMFSCTLRKITQYIQRRTFSFSKWSCSQLLLFSSRILPSPRTWSPYLVVYLAPFLRCVLSMLDA